ncbi:hypothetical protein J6590_059405, partial [Homalodisca vitripennis]
NISPLRGNGPWPGNIQTDYINVFLRVSPARRSSITLSFGSPRKRSLFRYPGAALVNHSEFRLSEETDPGQATFRMIILMLFSGYPGAALVNHSEFRLSEETDPGQATF